jgi:hypothetical protein
MLINIAGVWADAETEHQSYVDGIVKYFLTLEHGNYKYLASSKFGDFLQAHSATFALGKPAELEQIIAAAKPVLKGMNAVDKQAFRTDAKLVFNYGKFCAKNSPLWNAYSLCAKAKHTVCPYCQQAYAFTVKKARGGAFRPTLDHYYPKGKYPYLALSLYNLVPSCYSCNSSLKTTKDFYRKKHLHPFSDAEAIEFAWDIKSYLKKMSSGKSDFQLKLIFDKNNTSAKNSANTFLLKERFDGHARLLEVFAQAVQGWNESPILNSHIAKNGFNFNFTEQHALGFDKANYKNEMLGKIKLDLYDALIQWNKAWKP